MWVTRPERLKGAKDEVKRPEGPPPIYIFFLPSILLIGVEALATVIINVLVPVD